jgi:hypothetical protein
MQRYIFLAAHGNGDAALRVIGVRFAESLFGNDQDLGSVGSQTNRSAEPGDSRTHDDEIRFLHVSHELSGYRILSGDETMQSHGVVKEEA